jgi:hypothetical protein
MNDSCVEKFIIDGPVIIIVMTILTIMIIVIILIIPVQLVVIFAIGLLIIIPILIILLLTRNKKVYLRRVLMTKRIKLLASRSYFPIEFTYLL